MKTIASGFLIFFLFAAGIAGERTLSYGRFDHITVYTPDHMPTSVVLFISGDGGWNLGVIGMARMLAAMDAAVIGIDIIQYLKRLEATAEKCSYPSGDFELVSKYVQRMLNFPEYIVPFIVGYSSGATLAYALIVQAPQGTFAGAISMGFCPDLPLVKPLCTGSGLSFEPGPKGKGFIFMPHADLVTPWIAFQGTMDQVSNPAVVSAFVKQVHTAAIVSLPHVGHGFSVEKNWAPQFKQAFITLTQKHQNTSEVTKSSAAGADTAIAGLPLVEVPAQGVSNTDLAVLLTGDGGWAGIDKDIASALSKTGIAVVGFNTLKYFWNKRTPDEASIALEHTIMHYTVAWNKSGIILIGYSFGADILPFLANRFPPALLDRVKLLAFLGLEDKTDFQVKATNWLGGGPSKDALSVLPEIKKLYGKKMVYFYGVEEKNNIAAEVDGQFVKVVALQGGHHFNGRFDSIADSILTNIPR